MRDTPTRRAFLAAAGAAALAGCTGAGIGNPREETTGGGTETPTAEVGTTAGEAPQVPTADEQLPLAHSVSDLEDALVVGAGKDDIPAIDEPEFEPADAVGDRLAPGDPVFGVVRGGDAKAYPQAILVWHEVVNDTLDGQSASVTYCPLTGTVMGFERGNTSFGVSGRLVNNNLVMYDRATESWWSQMLGTAITGEYAGESLREFRVVWTTWGRWRDAHPDTQVLTRDTGYVRDYGNDPYGSYNPRRGYYDSDRLLFERLERDERHHEKAVFVGARTNDGTVAFEKDRIRQERAVAGDVGDVPHLAVHDADLDAVYAYRNPEGHEVVPVDGGYEGPDGETHPASDLPLDPVYAYDAMWFAWVGFYPNTAVHA